MKSCANECFLGRAAGGTMRAEDLQTLALRNTQNSLPHENAAKKKHSRIAFMGSDLQRENMIVSRL